MIFVPPSNALGQFLLHPEESAYAQECRPLKKHLRHSFCSFRNLGKTAKNQRSVGDSASPREFD
jgi:hypothetical protein